jgi:prepilin-type N-terminal cleavage/methylation domain-containing protein
MMYRRSEQRMKDEGGRMNKLHPSSCILHRLRPAFTLIEILIVIVILAILATIVVPQFSSASVNAKENTLKDELRYLRTQIVVYKAQHHDCPPGYPNGDRTASATGPDFIAQLTKPTDEDSVVNTVNTAQFKFGPYLSAMPTNPLTNLSAVQIVADADPMPDPTNVDYGWFYKPLTGEIIANSTGSDASGTAYKNY